MRFKEKAQDLFCKVLYLLKPIAIIRACVLFMLAVDSIGIVCLLQTQSSEVHDIWLAMVTGVTASVLVAVIVEMANNYQRNDKRWLRLSQLFSALTHYTQDVEIRTGALDVNKAHLDFMVRIHTSLAKDGAESAEDAAQALKEAAEAFCDDEDHERDHDRIRCVFSLLPGILPQIEDAYQNYSDGFKRAELESMRMVLDNWDEIKQLVEMALWDQSTLQFGKDPKNPGDLVTWLPPRIKRDLDRVILLELAMDAWESGRRRIASILVNEASSGLSALGIELGEEYLLDEEDVGAECEEGDSQNSNDYGKLISRSVSEIDHEIRCLQKIIKSEPGFRTIFTYFQKYNDRYRW